MFCTQKDAPVHSSNIENYQQLQGDFTCLIREPFKFSPFDIKVSCKNLGTLNQTVTQKNHEAYMMLTPEQVKILGTDENQALVDLKDVDQKNINYYTIDKKDGGNYEGKPKQDSLVITLAIQALMRLDRSGQSFFNPSTTHPLFAKALDGLPAFDLISKEQMSLLRKLLLGLQSAITVATKNSPVRFFTVESVSSFDMLLNPYYHSDSSQEIKC